MFSENRKETKLVYSYTYENTKYSKTGLKQPLKNRQNKDLNDKW